MFALHCKEFATVKNMLAIRYQISLPLATWKVSMPPKGLSCTNCSSSRQSFQPTASQHWKQFWRRPKKVAFQMWYHPISKGKPGYNYWQITMVEHLAHWSKRAPWSWKMGKLCPCIAPICWYTWPTSITRTPASPSSSRNATEDTHPQWTVHGDYAYIVMKSFLAIFWAEQKEKLGAFMPPLMLLAPTCTRKTPG